MLRSPSVHFLAVLQVDDVQLFTLHDEQTPSNDFSWNCQEYEGETVEYNLGGNTVAPPEASSPNSDSWLGTAFWPHQNCSPDEVTEDGTIFSLSTEGPVQESLICLPPHGATSLRNGTLQLPPHAAIVLNSSIKFHNVKIKGELSGHSPYERRILGFLFRTLATTVLLLPSNFHTHLCAGTVPVLALYPSFQ